ncbi:MAG TPA: FAD-dependent oxidoreductase, partial [Nocardioidaceae bacterium]|nr:FAD-dependent oxidoreductase [Nocardioidaceae bacterium]
MTRSAAIVGAGVGGLATAVGLTRNAWEVTVFERWDRTAGTGTGFGMWPPALRALDDLGVGETLRKEAQPQQDGVFRRPDGSVIATLDVDRLRRRAGEGVYLVSRPALLELLLAELPAGVVRFGEPVTRLDDLTTSYDVVVGADGLWSTTRAELLGDRHVPRYAGATVWR